MAKPSSKAATIKRGAGSKQAARSKPTGARKSHRGSAARTVKAVEKAAGITSAQRKDSKQSVVLAMLAGEGGATIEAVTKATHWQPHSVRGFFAGVVRKKLGFDLTSERVDGVRIYRTSSRRVASEAVRS